MPPPASPFPPAAPRRPAAAAFTLVELLVSVTILTVLTLLTSQLIGSASRVTTGSRGRMDADSQARTVFDRLNGDFARMLKNADVDCLFARRDNGSDGANDAFYLLTEAPAYSTEDARARSTTALVGYRVNSRFQLERLGKGLNWDGDHTAASAGGAVRLTYPTTRATADPASTLDGRWPESVDAPRPAGANLAAYDEAREPDAHVIADGVFRLEVCFLLTDHTFSNLPIAQPAGFKHNPAAPGQPTRTDDSAQGGYSVGSRWFDLAARRGYLCTAATPGAAVWTSAGVRDVTAVVVALGVLDAASRQTAPTRKDSGGNAFPDLSKLTAALPDPKETDLRPAAPPSAATPPKLPAVAWFGKVNGTDFAANAGLPRAAASQVRLYQRLFYLRTP